MIIQTRSTLSIFFVTLLAMCLAGYAGSMFAKKFYVTEKSQAKVATKPTNVPKPTKKVLTPTPSQYPTVRPTIKPTIYISLTPSPTALPLITATPTKPPDTSPPTTSIYYPANGGSIDYKTDGKVCAYEAPPSDDSGGQGIESFFKFDDREWKSGLGYFCEDSLPNGQHTLYFYSKDASGNVEDPKSITFTVNIPGN